MRGGEKGGRQPTCIFPKNHISNTADVVTDKLRGRREEDVGEVDNIPQGTTEQKAMRRKSSCPCVSRSKSAYFFAHYVPSVKGKEKVRKTKVDE